MKLVSSQNDADIRAGKADVELRFALRELTANLMRVARGAGKPYAVIDHVSAVLIAFRDYREAAGVLPSSERITEMIAVRRPERGGLVVLGYKLVARPIMRA